MKMIDSQSCIELEINSIFNFPVAIYISMNRPSLCRQLNNHNLNIFGELLDTEVA